MKDPGQSRIVCPYGKSAGIQLHLRGFGGLVQKRGRGHRYDWGRRNRLLRGRFCDGRISVRLMSYRRILRLCYGCSKNSKEDEPGLCL